MNDSGRGEERSGSTVDCKIFTGGDAAGAACPVAKAAGEVGTGRQGGSGGLQASHRCLLRE